MGDIPIRRSGSLEIFAFLWAFASIFHQANKAHWAVDGLDILMTFAAVLVIASPSSLANFMTLVVVQLADLLLKLPDISNHTVVMLISDIVIVSAYLRSASLRPNFPIDPGSLFDSFAPVLRVITVILYFYVTFHKLNWDYLDPSYSASVEHYRELARIIARSGVQLPMADWAKYCAIYGTLVIESAIPILLIFVRTRVAGLWLGLLFHFMLSIERYYDFTATVYALLFLFTPANFPDLLEDWWHRSRLGWIVSRAARATIFRTIPIQVWLAVLASLVLGTINILDRVTSLRMFKCLWMVFGVGIILAFAGAIHGRRSALVEQRGLLKLASSAFAIFPLLMLLNGACPYLGLKTRSCFAMFSNLRTEGGQTNHVLVPAWFQIAGFQKHMVRIIDSSDPFLASLAERGCSMPYFNLRTYITREGETW